MPDYDSIEDPYCYPGTTVLKNRLDIRDADALQAFEAEIADSRAREPLPGGRLSLSHFRAIHRHLFGDVYPWAGAFRTVRISKGGSTFCYPENIVGQLRVLFADPCHDFWRRGFTAAEFANVGAHFLSELNAIHAFREGNGRVQLAFMGVVSAHVGHPFDLGRLVPDRFLAAMITSFRGDEGPLAAQLREMID